VSDPEAPSSLGESLEVEAAHWLIELQCTDVSLERIAAWQTWLVQDASHAAAFLNVERAWLIAGQSVASAPPWPSDAEVADDGYDTSKSISDWNAARKEDDAIAPVHLREDTRSAAQHGRRWPNAAVFAGAVVSAVVAVGWVLSDRSDNATMVAAQAVQTHIAEIREVALPDGSTVTLGASTRLATMFDRHERRVRLEGGEAYFQVARSPARPFVVVIGDTAVTAVGTAFNVRSTGDRIDVAVSEGVVRVVPPPVNSRATRPRRAVLLGVGEQLSLGDKNMPAVVRRVDRASIAGWREGRLQYLSEPLSNVVADVARYSPRTIELSDPTIGELRVTGTVFADRLETWFRSLEVALPVQVIELPDGTVRIVGAPAAPGVSP